MWFYISAVAQKAASSASSSSQWLDTIDESNDDDCSSSSDGEDLSNDEDIEEHLLFLQGLDGADDLEQCTARGSAERADHRATSSNKVVSQGISIAPSRKIIKMYHKICKRSRKMVRASLCPHQYL
jgi:hypothetical protein